MRRVLHFIDHGHGVILRRNAALSVCISEQLIRAKAKLAGALDEFTIEGVHTTIPFHRKLMKDPVFRSGHFDTGFIEGFNIKD